MKPLSRSDEDTGEVVADWLLRSGKAPYLRGAIRDATRRRHSRRLAAGALALLVVVGVAMRPWDSRIQPAPVTDSLVPKPTVISAPERQTLPDGTVVELKPGSRIEEHFTADFRRVTLVRGAALFQVTHNAARPFIVSAREVEARDVGTVFAVQIKPSVVEVLVTEGSVSVDKPSDNDLAAPTNHTMQQPPVVVLAGNRITMGLGRQAAISNTEALSLTVIAEELSWRIPMLNQIGRASCRER